MLLIPNRFLRDEENGSFPAGGSGAPETNFNPFDPGASAPPAESAGQRAEELQRVRETTPEPVEKAPVEPTPARVQLTVPVKPVAAVPAVPPTGQPVVMTDEQLAKLAQSMRPQAQPVAAPAPQMTDDEFAKAFNVYKVTPEVYEAILGIKPDSPARVAALDAALQGVSRQSVTLARAMIDQAKQELGLQIAPARQAVLRQEMLEDHKQFIAANPDLKDYNPLLTELVASTRAKIASGEHPGFRNKQEAAQFVAQQARKLLNMPAPGQARPAQASQPVSGARPAGSRAMSTTSMGGRSSQPGGATPAKGLAETLFSESGT